MPMEGLRWLAAPSSGPTRFGDGESCPSGGQCPWWACGGRQWPGPAGWGAEVLSKWRSVSIGGLRGTAVRNGLGPLGGGMGSPAEAAVGAYGGTMGDGSSQRWGAQAKGTGSPAHTAVGAYGVPVGDGRPQWPGPTSRREQESCPSGGPCLWSECGGRHILTPRAHQLGGWGVLPRRRWVPMEPLRGMAGPNGPGPPPWGMRSPSQAAVGAYGGPVGDGSSQRPGATS